VISGWITIRAGLATILAVTACSPQSDGNPQSAADENTARPAALAGQGSTFTSRVKQLRITAASMIPQAPVRGGVELCSNYAHVPESPGAVTVAKAGWTVTGEATVGRYQAVSFVSGFEPATSGTCQLDDGNVALFKDGKPEAIVYGAKGVAQPIGFIKQIEGGLQILGGDVLNQPVANLHVDDEGSVTIVPVAASEKVCGGKASVPNVRGMPINKARETLIEAGWTPAPRGQPARAIEDSRAFVLARKGVTEVESCSGTGMGYCSFDYNAPAGGLSVTTVGDADWPTVDRFGVDCD
jgi:hypothetical protein